MFRRVGYRGAVGWRRGSFCRGNDGEAAAALVAQFANPQGREFARRRSCVPFMARIQSGASPGTRYV